MKMVMVIVSRNAITIQKRKRYCVLTVNSPESRFFFFFSSFFEELIMVE